MSEEMEVHVNQQVNEASLHENNIEEQKEDFEESSP